MASYNLSSLKSQLNQKGFRLTAQRETILRIFQTLPQGNHLSAEELHQLLKNQEERISLSTVYRTLNLMVKIRLLRELELAEGHKHYELNLPYRYQHHHLVCLQCHRTIEFQNDSILQIGKKQAEAEKLQLLDCQLTIHAVCMEAIARGWPSLLPSNWSCPKKFPETALLNETI